MIKMMINMINKFLFQITAVHCADLYSSCSILAVSLLKYSYDISSHSFCSISHTAVLGTSHGPSTSQAFIHLPIILFYNNLPPSS